MSVPSEPSPPVKLLDDLTDYAAMMAAASTPLDRITIIFYLLCFPLRWCYRAMGREYHRRLLREVTLKNSDGLFFCGKSLISCRNVNTRYEKVLRDYFDLTSGVFVDIGSHVGKYAIRVARNLGDNGKVIAIEPDPVNFSILKTNVRLNSLANIHLQNVACSDQDGWTTLFLNTDFPTQHSLFFDSGQGSVTVRVLSLDTIVSNLKIPKVDLLKIDVEAAEINVLRGATRTLAGSRPTILFEVWNEEHLTKAKELLLPLNYKLRRISGANYIAFQKKCPNYSG